MKKNKFKNFIGKFVVFTVVSIFSFVLLTLPAFATTEYFTFNLWDKYRNAIRIGYEYSDGSTTWENCYTNSNNVYIEENVTQIVSARQIIYYGNSNYANNFQISVPTDALKPVFYISEAYLNKPVKFTVMGDIILYQGIFSARNVLQPKFVLYTGTIDNYKQHPCTVSNQFFDITDTEISFKYDFTVTFKSTGYICGFWFNVGNTNGITVDLKGASNDRSFQSIYTFSPLEFSNDITEKDIQNSVESALNGVIGGDNYESPDNSSMDAYFDKENAIFDGLDALNTKFTIPDVLDVLNSNLDLKHALIHFSNIIEDFRVRLPFINILLLFSMGLGAIGFVFGLVQSIIRSRRK